MSHYIAGKISLARNCPTPPHAKNGGKYLRGRKRQGVVFEQKVSAHLAFSHFTNRWFEFWDGSGHHYCSPDVIFGWEGTLWVLECKYTLVEEGFSQVESLYRPVLEATYQRPVVGIQVCRAVAPAGGFRPVPWIAASLAEAMRIRLGGGARAAWHWPTDTIVGTQLPGPSSGHIDSARAIRQAAE